MSLEHNRALVRRFFDEVFSQGSVAVIDELFAPDCIYHLNTDVVMQGTHDAKAAIRSVRAMFPDLTFTVEEQVAEDDRIAARLTYHGTYHGGSEVFPPTARGKRFTARSLIVLHIVDGKIVVAYHSTDRLSQFRQLDLKLSPIPPE